MPPSDPPAAVLILSTAPNPEEAARIARALVEERLAACVNVVPGVRSFYTWEGAVQDEAEHLLLVKTPVDRRDAAIERLRALHSYTCPEAVVVPFAGGLPAYLGWLTEVTR